MTLTTVQVINEDNVVETVEIDSSDILAGLQDLVGGYIERVNCPKADQDGYHVLVDEEGIMNGKRVNEHASNLFGQTLLGPVVLIGKDDFV